MLFQMAWTHSPEARDKTIKQFMETGGMPPDGAGALTPDGAGALAPDGAGAVTPGGGTIIPCGGGPC